MHAMSMLSKYFINLSEQHLQLVYQIFDYFICTKNYTIKFNTQIESLRIIFCPSNDVFYTDNPDTRHSIQRYVFIFYKGSIDWKATKQCTVMTSTTEVELLALTLTGREII